VVFQTVLSGLYKSCLPETTSKNHSADHTYITKNLKMLVLEKRQLFCKGKHEQANNLKNKIQKMTGNVAHEYIERKVNHLFESKQSQ